MITFQSKLKRRFKDALIITTFYPNLSHELQNHIQIKVQIQVQHQIQIQIQLTP